MAIYVSRECSKCYTYATWSLVYFRFVNQLFKWLVVTILLINKLSVLNKSRFKFIVIYSIIGYF
uniref:GH21757p n=1 Tax=Drosophila melanogaster TaxID=7227 RepID=Q95T52_DROME|nr:GH21757p [Drosophila melanogaster]